MKRIVAAAALIVACVQAQGATTITMIDLPIPGSPRILDIRPDNAIATIVAVPGGMGYNGITGSSIPDSLGGRCGPVARTHDKFTARGYAVVLVDLASSDVAAILTWLWNRDHVPIWLVGTSASTAQVAGLAASITASIPMGVIFLAPYLESYGGLNAITRPAKVVYHGGDDISNGVAPLLYAGLTSSASRAIATLSGGIFGGECNGYHLMVGLEQEMTQEVASFIEASTPLILGPTAVEYFNAGFGHYFMTAQADEIAGLDGGAFNGAFARTGRSFKVFDAPATGTVPVCRFFTTPGTFGAKSSHFYTADPAECELVKTYPAWIYEKIAFHIAVPTGQVCPGGTTPVYRMYNNGQTQAPNHRFTTDLALYTQFTTSMNWSAEGIAFCAP